MGPMKTMQFNKESVTVEFTEFELMALAALVERGQQGIEVEPGDYACIRTAINQVADEFRSLLGHFEIAA